MHVILLRTLPLQHHMLHDSRVSCCPHLQSVGSCRGTRLGLHLSRLPLQPTPKGCRSFSILSSARYGTPARFTVSPVLQTSLNRALRDALSQFCAQPSPFRDPHLRTSPACTPLPLASTVKGHTKCSIHRSRFAWIQMSPSSSPSHMPRAHAWLLRG